MTDATLNTELNVKKPDDIYHALIQMLQSVGEDKATGAFAALALVLANQVGNDATVLEAIELVRRAYGAGGADAEPEETGHILVAEALERFFALHPADKFEGFTA